MVSSRVVTESTTWRVRSPSNAGSKTYLKGGEGRGGQLEGGGVDVDCILIVKHSVYADSQEGQTDDGREDSGTRDRRLGHILLEREYLKLLFFILWVVLLLTSLVMLPEKWVKFSNLGRDSCDTLAVVG